jgi:hypothetical protein
MKSAERYTPCTDEARLIWSPNNISGDRQQMRLKWVGKTFGVIAMILFGRMALFRFVSLC